MWQQGKEKKNIFEPEMCAKLIEALRFDAAAGVRLGPRTAIVRRARETMRIEPRSARN
jgi:hypothetical protein